MQIQQVLPPQRSWPEKSQRNLWHGSTQLFWHKSQQIGGRSQQTHTQCCLASKSGVGGFTYLYLYLILYLYLSLFSRQAAQADILFDICNLGIVNYFRIELQTERRSHTGAAWHKDHTFDKCSTRSPPFPNPLAFLCLFFSLSLFSESLFVLRHARHVLW